MSAAWLSLKLRLLARRLRHTWHGSGICFESYGQIRGKTMMAGWVTAPLVIARTVITGLSLLLLFVRMERPVGWPAVAYDDDVIAHTTFSASVCRGCRAITLFMRWMKRWKSRPMILCKACLLVFLITLPFDYNPQYWSGWLRRLPVALMLAMIASFRVWPRELCAFTTLPMWPAFSPKVRRDLGSSNCPPRGYMAHRAYGT